MTDHKLVIKGVADFKDFEKTIKGLRNTVESSFGKKGIKLFDESSVSIIKKDLNAALSDSKETLKSLRKEAVEITKQFINASNDEKKHGELVKKRLETTRRILETHKLINTLQGAQIGAPEGGGGLGGALGMAGGFALAAGALVGGAAISRGKAGFGAYQQGVPDILKLSGMGISPIQNGAGRAGATELGYNQFDVLQTQLGANSAFGKTGAGGEQNRLNNILTSSRGLGLDPGEITGAGNQLRAAGGTEQAQKQVGMILEKAFTNGMDKSQASHFLSASTELLSSINETGMSSTEKMISALSDIVGKGAMSPEQAARSFANINSAISGSGGESNAFFQAAAARGGLGGGTIQGTQFAVRQGLTGVDLGAMNKQIGGTQMGNMGMQAVTEMGLTDPQYTQKFAKSILDDLKSRVDMTTKEGRQAALGFTAETFGVKTAGEAAKVLALLEKLSKGGTERDRKELMDITKDREESWRQQTLANLDKIALNTARSAAYATGAQFDLGKSLAPLFNSLIETLGRVDETMARIAGSQGGQAAVNSIASPINSAVSSIEDMGQTAIQNPGSTGYTNEGDPYAHIGDAIQSFLGMFMSSGSSDKTGSTGGGTETQAASPEQTNDSIGELLKESKKQTDILQKGLLRNGPPRAGRESSR